MNILSLILAPVRNSKFALIALVGIFSIVELFPTLFSAAKPCQTTNLPPQSTITTVERRIKPLSQFFLNNFRLLSANNVTNSLVRTELCQTQLFLRGKINVTFEAPSFEKIAQLNPQLHPGGQFRPNNCEPEQLYRIAVIIPYRNRTNQLRALLHHLHPILQRQQLDYVVIVVEQAGNDTFNKALLMNIAFKEALQLVDPNDQHQFDCFIFHDVDLFLEDDRGLYYCENKPIHLSEYIDKFNYQSWGGTDILFGGVVSIKRRIFELVNGYSNVFFGWGGEDEEMRKRLRLYKIPIVVPRRNDSFYLFKMARHEADAGNPWNENGHVLIRQTNERMRFDGLNSLRYNLLSREFLPTHTHVLVNFTREDIYEAVYGERTENLTHFDTSPGD